jgi:phosphoglycerate kinase
MHKLRIQDLSVQNKKALVRVDFNVPLNSDGTISDATRIKESLPTIEYLLKNGASVILMSHLGRPKAKVDPKFSLKICVDTLSKLLQKPVLFSTDCVGEEAKKLAASLKPGQVLLLENLRFHEAEEKPEKDPSFAKQLSELGDIYINDAFGTAHREHSSTATIAKFFPKKAAAGFLMQKEIDAFVELLTKPKRPFYAIVGGAKISSKIGVLSSLLKKVDGIFLGGGMAYTFFKLQGIPIGDSICENDSLETARNFLEECKQKNIILSLPKDIIIANQFSNDAEKKCIAVEKGVPDHWQGMDIGPETIKDWKNHFTNAKTFFWNGPLGVFEFPNFAAGTQAIAQTLSELPAKTIVGGGDSVAAINGMNLGPRFAHLSTGGGASLEYIEYGHLPGIDALSDGPSR